MLTSRRQAIRSSNQTLHDAVRSGYTKSLFNIQDLFMKGYATKNDYVMALLRAYQICLLR